MHQALVVGIDRYPNQPHADLLCAARDARAVGQRLTAAGFEVVTLVDEDASLRRIIYELENGLNTRATDDDGIVAVYWAGHGYSRPDGGENDNGFGTFLLPYDGMVREPLGSALAVSQLWAALERLKTKRLVVFLDTCFSGAATARGRTLPSSGSRDIAPLAPLTTGFLDRIGGEGRVVIAACGPRQVAREDPNGSGHGFFTKVVLDALGGRAHDPEHADGIRISLLSDYIRANVERETGLKQQPHVHHTSSGKDFVFPMPPREDTAKFPLPSWAFAGTAGGVGKSTLATLTAELLAEADRTVLYLDLDIGNKGGTHAWLHRAGTGVGKHRTFADHVAAHGAGGVADAAGVLSDRLIDVTPDYLQKRRRGRILLLPSVRPDDQEVFAFGLMADIRNGRSNEECRDILDECVERGLRLGVDCVVIDCGAQFDNVAVNAMHAAHHPFIVASAVAGSRASRDTMIANCRQIVPSFDRFGVLTVVNRAPSVAALERHWGELDAGYRFLPYDPELFGDWAMGWPNFELGYDQLSKTWYGVLVQSDKTACAGEHRAFLPQEWDRFAKWALWISDHPEWPAGQIPSTRRSAGRHMLSAVAAAIVAAVAAAWLLRGDLLPGAPGWLDVVAWVAGIPAALTAGYLGLLARSHRRRVRLLRDLAEHGEDRRWMYEWFSADVPEAPRWQVWKHSHRAAIVWLHQLVEAARWRL